VGFIGYRRMREGASEAVRIYLECRDEPGGPQCRFVVDVVFPGGSPALLRGVDGVLALKKFYKLVFSLEERAREHGNDWHSVMESSPKLLEHLRYTRNARDFTQAPEPLLAQSPASIASAECTKADK
jgi:hypothetical protein